MSASELLGKSKEFKYHLAKVPVSGENFKASIPGAWNMADRPSIKGYSKTAALGLRVTVKGARGSVYMMKTL